MSGLDLSKCKKISQDKNRMTLRHPDGHEIKVALSGLSASMRKKFEDMPVHKAEGGDPIEPPVDIQQPETVQLEQPIPQQEGAPQLPPPPGYEAPIPEAAAQQFEPNAAPLSPEEAKAASPTRVPDWQLHPYPMTAQERDAESLAYQQDLATGKITPKTYKELFADKSTLGKIGTIFGMLLAGGGSGVTGQPDQLMEMMNKEIERDLDAQKATKENAQNFLKLHYAHELQNAQAKRMEYENELTKAQTAGVPTEIALKRSAAAVNRAQAAEIDAKNAGLGAYNAAKNAMLTTSIQELDNNTANNPQANAVVKSKLAPAVANEILSNNAKTAEQQKANIDAANKAAKEQPQEGGEPQAAIDYDKLKKAIFLGKNAPEMKGAIPPGEVAKVEGEASDIETNRALAAEYYDTFQKLKDMALAGTLNEQRRKALISQLNAKIAKDTTNRFVSAEAAGQLDSIFPSKFDYGKARPEKFEKQMQSFKDNEAGAVALRRYGLMKPFPNYSYDNKKTAVASGNIKDGETITSKSGRSMTRVDGKWVYSNPAEGKNPVASKK